jgi:PAS domain-containing protein
MTLVPKTPELLMARTQAIGHVGGWELTAARAAVLDRRNLSHPRSESRKICADRRQRHQLLCARGETTIDTRCVALRGRRILDLDLPLYGTRAPHLVRAIGEAQREDGRVTHIYGTLQNITDQAGWRCAARASAESILDHAAEGMIVLSATGVIERFNREAQQMFGYGWQEIRGLHLRDHRRAGV